MTMEWDEHGVQTPLTVLWIDNCQVVQVKHASVDNTTALQLGCGSKKGKRLSAPQRGHFERHGVPFKSHLAEFPVTSDALLPVGTELQAAHFKAGQFVDVTGTTIGKGFQGTIKLHKFAGQDRSHGNSKAHRKPGSIGMCQDPGRVFPGKKMAGRMGGNTRTVLNVRVHRVDPARNLLYLVGQVPGHAGNYLRVRDALRQPFSMKRDLPFPTFLEPELPETQVAPSPSNRYAVHY